MQVSSPQLVPLTIPSQLHALVCCLKAVSSSVAASYVERGRLACGGHGYMHSSNLPCTYGMATAACTYEGENTVMMLQTARKLTSCVNNIERLIRQGLSHEAAWNQTSVRLVELSEAHCRAIVLSTYRSETVTSSSSMSPALGAVLQQLVQLYAVFLALERTGDLLMYTSISEPYVVELQHQYEGLLLKLRPNAVGLVDAFDYRDEVLSSTLGAYDGRVYERLMQEALRSPLNAEPVNQSFRQHLKPFMQGKL